MDNIYYTIKDSVESTTVIERSKFICYLKHIENEDDAKEFIGKIKKINSLATHNCYAYISDDKGQSQKFSDDGEPQGTAGSPMLEVLKNKKLYKICAVVTRFFGGIKLGTGGLARAYGGAVKECLDKAEIVSCFPSVFYQIECNYEEYNKILKILCNESKIISTDFNDGVKLTVVTKKELFESVKSYICEITSGNAILNFLREDYFGF